MQLFQNSGVYPAYFPRLESLAAGALTFKDRLGIFLGDRYGAAHVLQPVLRQEPNAFFTNGDDVVLQRQWARENGLPAGGELDAILLAQIEHHRTELFYNMDPMRYGSEFVRRLPGCVRGSIAWRAAPSPGADFDAYDLLVCNFPGILDGYRARGWTAAYFSPAHDPEMDTYASCVERPIDVLFVGGYSRHHQQRARILEAVSTLRTQSNVVFCLDRSRLTRLAESPLGRLLPLGRYRRPSDIRAVSHEPVFGRDLYAIISRAKIVLNGAVDMAGSDRGNMRCFEAMGCGALMVSDQGIYPQGMRDGATMRLYEGAGHARSVIQDALRDPAALLATAREGQAMLRERYSKTRQWADFVALVEAL